MVFLLGQPPSEGNRQEGTATPTVRSTYFSGRQCASWPKQEETAHSQMCLFQSNCQRCWLLLLLKSTQNDSRS